MPVIPEQKLSKVNEYEASVGQGEREKTKHSRAWVSPETQAAQ